MILSQLPIGHSFPVFAQLHLVLVDKGHDPVVQCARDKRHIDVGVVIEDFAFVRAETELRRAGDKDLVETDLELLSDPLAEVVIAAFVARKNRRRAMKGVPGPDLDDGPG